MRNYFKRAAILGALLLFSVKSWSVEPVNERSETYKNILEKAYNLGLQKERNQALTILVNAIAKENKPQAIVELKTAITDISRIFFSDKAQQSYESGVSLMRTDLNKAGDKISEGLRLEPDNFKLVVLMSTLLIAKSDCRQAMDLVQKKLNIVSFDESLKLSLAQGMACVGRWKELTKISEPFLRKTGGNQKFWISLETQRHLDQKNFAKASETLQSLQKLDDKYPETAYWDWKVNLVRAKPSLIAAQNYLRICKNLSANQYREYMIDPWLCRRTNEIENYQKGLHESAD